MRKYFPECTLNQFLKNAKEYISKSSNNFGFKICIFENCESLFFFFSNCLLMLVQMETFVFPFSCVPILVWVLPEADVETQIQVQFI